MFNVEFLHEIREYELAEIMRYLPRSSRILEIGGGTGYQAKQLQDAGYSLESIDIPDGNYTDQRVFPVKDYDGVHIPFPDDSFDIVFSSNVLEHVRDLPALDKDIRRVLRPNGYCVHVMPTGAWRGWTNIAHYTELVQRLLLDVRHQVKNRGGTPTRALPKNIGREWYKLLRHYLIVPRHGETGNALTEIYTFSKLAWLKKFRELSYRIDSATPLGLFYTGHMVFGKRVPIKKRCDVANLLGSACVIYTVKPQPLPQESAAKESGQADAESATRLAAR